MKLDFTKHSILSYYEGESQQYYKLIDEWEFYKLAGFNQYDLVKFYHDTKFGWADKYKNILVEGCNNINDFSDGFSLIEKNKCEFLMTPDGKLFKAIFLNYSKNVDLFKSIIDSINQQKMSKYICWKFIC